MTPISSVFLGSAPVQFTTDPKTYDTSWAKRSSVHRTIGGVTIQDFGLKAKDITLRLESQGQFLDQETVDAIQALYAVRGAAYAFVDYRGTEATVFITLFEPEPTFIPGFFEYTMELQVVALTKLRGIAYNGD